MNDVRRRLLRAMVVAAAGATLLVPAGVDARGARPVGSGNSVLQVTVGDRCVNGSDFVVGDPVKLTVKRGATTVASVSFTPTATVGGSDAWASPPSREMRSGPSRSTQAW